MLSRYQNGQAGRWTYRSGVREKEVGDGDMNLRETFKAIRLNKINQTLSVD